MAGQRQLLLYWDPEIDGAFRRRFESALREMGLTASDAAGIDLDPDAPLPARIGIVSPNATGWSAETDLLVIGGEGDPPKHARTQANVIRLKESDVIDETRAGRGFAERLRKLTGHANRDLDPDTLREQLQEASRRAEEAERARAQFELERNDAIRAARRAEAELASERARTKALDAETQHLKSLTEDTAFALNLVPTAHRAAVTTARHHAWQARLAAASAAKAADKHPDALVWKKPDAIYSGETRNARPHGYGVQLIRENGSVISTYRGEFADGQRHGHGVAEEADGHVWCGQWRAGEAVGFGCLTTPDGRRFEGETIADRDGEPVSKSGFTWDAPGQPGRNRKPVHAPVATLLPAPDTQAAGG
jgi:hypothetical protein